jgi:MoaE-MoaD fusion protein
MDVEVSFYGNLVRVAGARTRRVRVDGDAPTVSDLRAAIRREIPGVAPHLDHTAVGMGTELLPDDAPLVAGAEISLLPPVSGGEHAAGRVQDGPLSLDALIRETGGVDDGALVVFAGNVRARDAGAEVSGLDYDVHREMAEKVIRGIEEAIERQEGILACRIVHRVGFVPAGEASVYVVVRGRHRPEAFRAAREGIDRVKSEAPIWKEDVGADGTRRPRSNEEGTPLVGGKDRP